MAETPYRNHHIVTHRDQQGAVYFVAEHERGRKVTFRPVALMEVDNCESGFLVACRKGEAQR